MVIFTGNYFLRNMAEVFYDMSHLSTDELRELFTSYRRLGWVDYEYEVYDENLPPIEPQLDTTIRMGEAGLGINIVPECSLHGLSVNVNIYKLDFMPQCSTVSVYYSHMNENPVLRNFIIEGLNFEDNRFN